MRRIFILALLCLSTGALYGENVTGTHGTVIVDGDTPADAGVVLRSLTTRPGVAVQMGAATGAAGFSVFNSASAELLRIRPDSTIVLGGASASSWSAAMLPVLEATDTSISFGDDTDLLFTSNAYYRPDQSGWRYKTADSVAGYYLYKGGHYWRVAPAGAADALIGWNMAMRIVSTGDVGIGTVPLARLHVSGGTTAFRAHTANSSGFGLEVRDLAATEGYGSGVLTELQGNSLLRVSNLQLGALGGQPQIASTAALPLYLNRNTSQPVTIGNSGTTSALRVEGTGVSSFAGSVTVAGNLQVTGNIAAKYQDMAEWVPSETDLEPGTVVVLSTDRSNAVKAASRAYDTTVAGVVSPQPGLILGDAGSDKELIATTGRVRVKVDATAGPVNIGDLLVSSDKPGRAMKSEPLQLNGRQFHQPGTIIGKALERLPRGEGEILVLLSMQ